MVLLSLSRFDVIQDVISGRQLRPGGRLSECKGAEMKLSVVCVTVQIETMKKCGN